MKRDLNMNKLKWSISISALLGIAIHLIWPELKIDAVTLGLLLLAFAPWISPIIKSIEIPGVGKVELHQEQDSEAETPGGKIESKIKMHDEHGFFTQDGLRHLIDESGLVENGESVKRTLLIFSTANQRTWLVATGRQLFCILDDEKTRSSARLIQWRMPLLNASPVSVSTSSRGNPVVHIGTRKNWLYSTSLHSSPIALRQDIESMISEAQRA
jgi:hypothetical protein